MKKKKKGTHEEFMKKNFIRCSCGYTNKKENVEKYGTCTNCKKIIDNKCFFKRKLKIEIKKTNVRHGLV